ncbi:MULTISPECIES: zinc ribbon domain-containing protein [Aerosakkonema]|uniref:zinc ribbon domain-containing protein n=1 Tax=Aerosakkonema TaxID=1246629 RepID=UPI0035B87ADC
MPNCPRCHQPVKTQALTCPHCRQVLKAHGHPGIPLHRAAGKEYLCDSCTYHADDTCTYPQRPLAKECTLYHNRFQPEPEEKQPLKNDLSLRFWFERNLTWVLLLGLLAVSFLVALMR